MDPIPVGWPEPIPAWMIALERARHELVTLNGLWAHDGQPPDAPEQWQIDTSAVIAVIDAVLPPGPGPWLPPLKGQKE